MKSPCCFDVCEKKKNTKISNTRKMKTSNRKFENYSPLRSFINHNLDKKWRTYVYSRLIDTRYDLFNTSFSLERGKRVFRYSSLICDVAGIYRKVVQKERITTPRKTRILILNSWFGFYLFLLRSTVPSWLRDINELNETVRAHSSLSRHCVRER